MTHPLNALAARPGKGIFISLVAFTLLMMVVMNWLGGPLNTPAAPSGIVSFEIAGTLPNAQAMLDSWDGSAKVHAAFIQGLDFLFPMVYSTTVALGCLLAGGVLRSRRWPASGLGAPLAWGLWVAAAFDYVENIALVALLLGPAASPWPQIALVCASLKFGLLFLGLVYCFFGLAARLTPAPQP